MFLNRKEVDSTHFLLSGPEIVGLPPLSEHAVSVDSCNNEEASFNLYFNRK